MAGWTILLLWADRAPLERRGVLAITVFPVVVGFNGVRYMLYLGGLAAEPFTAFGITVAVTLTVLFLFSYFNSMRGDAKSA
jgi:hypothetical protein